MKKITPPKTKYILKKRQKNKRKEFSNHKYLIGVHCWKFLLAAVCSANQTSAIGVIIFVAEFCFACDIYYFYTP